MFLILSTTRAILGADQKERGFWGQLNVTRKDHPKIDI